MSHSRERSEKTCLNCNAQLYGRFCHICGQENIEPRESLWNIITHFFNDITHFDGKFFKTTGLLLTRPGYLPLEYINGRRARYLHPIRLYLFTSFVFFIIFYSLSSYINVSQPVINVTDGSGAKKSVNPFDTLLIISSRQKPYTSVAEYDSVQGALSAEARDGWFENKLTKQSIVRRNKYSGKSDAIFLSMIDNFIHSFPYLLFVSLPISALYLQLLYIGNRNNVYSGHAIFLVYLYVFTFLLLLGYFGLYRLRSEYNAGWIGYIQAALLTYIGVYTFVAMKVYYGNRWGRTFWKFVIWNLLAFFTILALFVIFFIISLLKV